MTEQTKHSEPPEQKQIEEYLQENADFLLRYPELLLTLDLPNQQAGNVTDLSSLLISKMREEIAMLTEAQYSYQTQLSNDQEFHDELLPLWEKALSTVPRQNHRARNVIASVLHLASRYCGAEHATLFVFANAHDKIILKSIAHTLTSCTNTTTTPIDGSLSPESYIVLDENDKRRHLFSSLFNQGNLLRDSLQHEHLVALFGKNQGANIKSSVLAPFSAPRIDLLLALGNLQDTQPREVQLSRLMLLGTVLTTICGLFLLRADTTSPPDK